MKRTIAFFFALCTLAAGSIMAQETIVTPESPEFPAEEPVMPKVDKQIVNHLAIGVPIDLFLLPDGIGIIEVATTLTPYLQFRAGWSWMPTIKATINEINKIAGDKIPTQIKINDQKSINIGDSQFAFNYNLGGFKFFMDVYPGKKTPFHFSFGFLVNDDSAFKVRADLSSALKQAGFQEGKYNEVYFGLSEDDPRFRVSTDPNGILTASLHTWAVRPYAGIGFGRAIDPKKRVKVSFDMGAYFWGSPVLVASDYSLDSEGRRVAFTPERLRNSKDLQSLAQPMEIVQKISAYPVMKLNIFIRVF